MIKMRLDQRASNIMIASKCTKLDTFLDNTESMFVDSIEYGHWIMWIEEAIAHIYYLNVITDLYTRGENFQFS